MKKNFRTVLVLTASLCFIIFAPNIVYAQCASAGGDCYESCTGDHSTPLPQGDSGCVNTQGHFCCGKSSTANTTASLGDKTTILGESVDTGSLNGFMQLALAITKWILGLSGSAALLMFVYGGVMMLISGGSSDKVKQGKDIIIGSVVGLLIVFASYTIIGFVISTMGVSAGSTGGWASSNWFK